MNECFNEWNRIIYFKFKMEQERKRDLEIHLFFSPKLHQVTRKLSSESEIKNRKNQISKNIITINNRLEL